MSDMKLTRRFSPLTLLLLSINGMVGSAWLFAPLYAAKIAGAASIWAWLIGGAGTALIALSFAELSVLLPVAGGTSSIPLLSHGRLTSFVMSWVAWLSALTMPPIEVQAILQYAATYFPALMRITQGVPVLSGVGFLWAMILMLALSLMNIASFKGFIRWNFTIFSFKIMVIVLTIAAFIKTQFHVANFYHQSEIGSWHAILAAVATGGVAFAFTGFKHGVELAEEAKNTRIAIPLAIVGSVIACLILYLGLQIAFIGALAPQALQHGWQQLSFTGDMGPFVGMAAGLGLIWLLRLLYVDALVSPFGAGLIYVTSTARILYAMSRNGYFPKWLLHVNQQGFPVWAIVVNFVLGMLLFLPFPGWQAMVSFLVSAMVVSYAMGPIALLCLRRELPQQQRLFRLPVAHIICGLSFYFCNLLIYWTGWDTLSKLGIALLIGFAAFLQRILTHKNKDKLGLQSAYWLLPYLAGVMIISYLGNFGGKAMIPFGWDFAVIAVFSITILMLAVKFRLPVTEVDYQAACQSPV